MGQQSVSDYLHDDMFNFGPSIGKSWNKPLTMQIGIKVQVLGKLGKALGPVFLAQLLQLVMQH